VITLQDALDAKESGDVDAAHENARFVMIADPSEIIRRRAEAIYAWTLIKRDKCGEALEHFRHLQTYYVREDGRLTLPEAIMIIEQVRILRLLNIDAAANGLLAELFSRIQEETSSELAAQITEKLNQFLDMSRSIQST
jgi:hypothetical protein